MARPKAPKGFAQVRDDLGEHMTGDELVERMDADDAHVSNTAFSGLELSDVSANGTVFENVIFRSCQLAGVNLST